MITKKKIVIFCSLIFIIFCLYLWYEKSRADAGKKWLEIHASSYKVAPSAQSFISRISEMVFGKEVIEIELRGGGINDIRSIEPFTSTKKLGLESLTITNLDDLENFTELEFIYAAYSEITNLQGLKNCGSLKEIVLYDTPIEDLKGIENLKNLEKLDISATKVLDLNLIAKLSNLKFLNIYSTYIKDISVLRNLKNLEKLDISSTDVVEVDSLFHLKKLKYLVLPAELSDDKINKLKKALPNCEIDLVDDERDIHFPNHIPRKPDGPVRFK